MHPVTSCFVICTPPHIYLMFYLFIMNMFMPIEHGMFIQNEHIIFCWYEINTYNIDAKQTCSIEWIPTYFVYTKWTYNILFIPKWTHNISFIPNKHIIFCLHQMNTYFAYTKMDTYFIYTKWIHNILFIPKEHMQCRYIAEWLASWTGDFCVRAVISVDWAILWYIPYNGVSQGTS